MNKAIDPDPLGDRVFTDADQQAFAAWSGDVNPMHVDSVAARRLLSGRQVVHGVHLLLQAIDRWRPVPASGPLRALHGRFNHPISVGDRVQFDQRDLGNGRWLLRACVGALVCAEVELESGPAAALGSAGESGPKGAGMVRRDVGGLTVPLDEAPGSQAGQQLVLPPRGRALAEAFPRAADRLGPAGVDALGRLSYFVGMVCPGLHSVFSSLQATIGHKGDTPQTLHLRLQRYDPRFKLFIVAFDGPLSGELRAFRRPPPLPQPSTRALSASVRPGEFAGTRSLVVGASRGLGELTAKLLAAGGGDVLVSYAKGAADAEAVVQDMVAARPGSAAVVHIDLDGPAFQPPDIQGPLTAVFYFATPRIFRKQAEVFDAEQFAVFTRFYLERFAQLCGWLEERDQGAAHKTRVYLPSTVFIDDRPRGMTEYSMAKAAAEVLADDLNRSLRRVEILHTRLPRLATDQTASVAGIRAEGNLESMLPVVRRVMVSGQ